MKKNLIILFCLLFLSLSVAAKPKVIVLKIDGGIGPATAGFIKHGIEYSEDERAAVFIIELNTPGGLLESTRNIVRDILRAKVPVVVYVSPSGSRAGSAGVFITLSANIAVMAPGTNIGAAHPVGMGGESDSSSVMYDKVTNDAAAFMRTIAQKRKKNIQWAERAVRESISATENEALDSGAIDFICPDIDSLLNAIDGMTIETAGGNKKLNVKDAKIEFYEKNWKDELLGIISDPNIAYLLMLLGIYGIFFELYNPGAIFPGVVGGISIILAAYSLQMLPINYAGLALILLSVILFIVEIYVASHGLLSIGGVISFILGSIMLIDSPFEFLNISLTVIITAAIFTATFFIFIVTLGLKAQIRKKATGMEGLIGEIGIAIYDISPLEFGKVKVHGEIWKATSDSSISAGQSVIVISVDGLTLKVRAKGKQD